MIASPFCSDRRRHRSSDVRLGRPHEVVLIGHADHESQRPSSSVAFIVLPDEPSPLPPPDVARRDGEVFRDQRRRSCSRTLRADRSRRACSRVRAYAELLRLASAARAPGPGRSLGADRSNFRARLTWLNHGAEHRQHATLLLKFARSSNAPIAPSPAVGSFRLTSAATPMPDQPPTPERSRRTVCRPGPRRSSGCR